MGVDCSVLIPLPAIIIIIIILMQSGNGLCKYPYETQERAGGHNFILSGGSAGSGNRGQVVEMPFGLGYVTLCVLWEALKIWRKNIAQADFGDRGKAGCKGKLRPFPDDNVS